MENSNNILQKALKYHQEGNLNDAAAFYLQVYKTNPHHIDVVFLIGTLYLQSGKLDAAATFLKKVIILNPNHVKAHNNLGIIFQNQGKLDEAVESYYRALNLAPDNAEAFYNLGTVYNKQRKYDKALENYKHAILFRPDNYDAHLNIGNIFQELGKPEDAATCYRKVITLKPDFVIAHNNLGIVLSKLCKHDDALKSFRNALNLKPVDPKIHSNIASALKESGRLDEAMESCKKAIELDSNHAEAYNNLGTILQKTGNHEDAIINYNKAIRLKPEDPDTHNNLGSALKELGRIDEAKVSCRRAIAINPEYADAYNNLGTILQEEGRLDEAITNYKQVIMINVNHAMAYSNLGTALHEQGKFEKALQNCQHAVTLNQHHPYLHNNLGTILQELRKFDEAIVSYNRAIELKPDYAEAYGNLGAVYKKQGNAEDALTYYKKSRELKPLNAEVHKNIGIILEEFGNTHDALISYQKSLQLKHNPGIEIKVALLHPTINESQESIKQYRKNLFKGLEALNTKGLKIEDPTTEIGSTNFFLVYQGLDDKEIQKKIASFHINVCPELSWISPDINKERSQSNKKIKLGIISHYLTNHTIGLLNHGIIKHICRERFHVTLFRFNDEDENATSKAIDCDADDVIVLPRKLKPARQKIAECSLDILFYLEIGMDTLTYFLAFSRLAPVQCVTWGHPVTTGIPNIDYFISSEMAELPGAEKHYTEQLVLPDRLTIYYYRPKLTQELRPREYFGLHKNYNLYVCPQTLFKLHPDFDKTLGNLLRKDKYGLLVLIEGKYKHWEKMLLDRFSRTFSDVIARVKFLPRMATNEYLSLLNISDVLLDPPHYGGGNTSLEAFAFNIPIVTWPGDYLRSRLTLALYKKLNIMECVVDNSVSYVDTAYRLANDKAWRSEITERIKLKADCLYEDRESVHELEQFFEMAIEKAYNRK
ncbi:hypothetical protein SCALIN_C05_0094 [Candidatus Scalindua japonica]|uniref:Probable UDP-N-acetylglucosamine--peptide N-acetylglucosaminyltransferase SPINDLY n=1 Tax=Candidatus Scalindua japonica TaxID=1284222 RepID=A0A286TVW4_9BACT|nr:tetratricopeptide repeat protein [Candidatus Scalindua japonica]GAX60009.1 hypothetical protein SCALIN_C05_0094 [Candidatus Scalindua japonica]